MLGRSPPRPDRRISFLEYRNHDGQFEVFGHIERVARRNLRLQPNTEQPAQRLSPHTPVVVPQIRFFRCCLLPAPGPFPLPACPP